MNTSTIARDIIGILIILGAIASFFFNVSEIGATLIRILSGIVVGFYFGREVTPLGIGMKKVNKAETKE
jgi:uncharacterized membrane protein YgaE (UPF0421/DUF939 family)